MSVDWLKLKKEKGREKERLPGEGGDYETRADIDYLLKHKDEDIKSFEELRARRKALERRIDAEAAAERRRIDEEKQAIRRKALEDFTIAHLNEYLFVTINGKRLKKLKSLDDLKCPRCGQLMYRARGMCIEMAEHYMQARPEHAASGAMRPGLLVENLQCKGCNEWNSVTVQVVY